MQLSELSIYPIKSCRGIFCSTALLEERGLQYNRQWMIMDQDSKLTSSEPNKTLSTYRAFKGKIHFGQNAIATKTGTLQIGSLVITTIRQQP
jgi:uncharacterized protein YcbX